MGCRRLEKRVLEYLSEYNDKGNERKALQYFFMYLIVLIIGILMAIIDEVEGRNFRALSTGLICVGVIGQFLVLKRKLKLSGCFIGISYLSTCFVMLFYCKDTTLSIMCTFIVPFGLFLILGLKKGAILNFILCIGIFILFYMPVSSNISYYNNIKFRYPLAFFAMFLFALLIEWIRTKDLKEMEKLNNSLQELVYVDSTTGSPNFNKFQKECSDLLMNNNLLYVMIAIDIAGFKVINDKYGYKFGNEVLINLSDELKRTCKDNEIYAREGADRFILLLNYYDENLLEVRIMNINEKLKFSTPKHSLRLNYGIYRIEDRSLDIWTLYDRALMAKSIAERNELVNYSFYEEEIRRKLLNEKFMEESMDSALLNREFVVYYQPKYNLKEERYCGAEALVRWQRRNGLIIPPSEFISFFEKKGFITKIDMYVLREVCINMERWIKDGKEPITVSVNISKIDFYKESLLDDIISIVDSYNIPHKYIELEMTETIAAESLEEFCSFSNRCRMAGFKVSMDDFGSGYSSLTMMKDLSVDVIKLDKSMFPDNINDEKFKKGKVIIEHIINLSKELNMQVVAEGIEDKELVDELRRMNCDIIQGYYYGEPMIYEKLNKLIYRIDE